MIKSMTRRETTSQADVWMGGHLVLRDQTLDAGMLVVKCIDYDNGAAGSQFAGCQVVAGPAEWYGAVISVSSESVVWPVTVEWEE